MHSYGENQLASLPPHSLLVSHTDLDWNPTRYLQECHKIRADDVTHLSFQLMAYPWFATQQANLYPKVRFPNTAFPGVSTNRMEEGNAVLVRNFLVANGAEKLGIPPLPTTERHDHEGDNSSGSGRKAMFNGVEPSKGNPYPGGLYLDMQSINEVELEPGGRWRGLTLIPWGTLYRVLGPLSIRDTEPLHRESLERFKEMQNSLPEPTDAFFEQYPPGTWEFAVMSVYHDAQNQLGLNLLTHAIELQKNADLMLLPLLLDRLHTSAKLLFNCHSSVSKHGALSSGPGDLHKNTAMAWMRLQGLVGVAFQFRDSILKLMETSPEIGDNLFDRDVVNTLVNKLAYSALLRHAKIVIKGFIDEHPDDRDVKAFEAALQQIEVAERGDPTKPKPPPQAAASQQQQKQQAKPAGTIEKKRGRKREGKTGK